VNGPLVVVAAMEQEVSDLLRGRRFAREGQPGLQVWRANEALGGAVLAVCGVGRDAAVKTTSALLRLEKPRLVVSIGVAGGLVAQLRAGDLLLAKEVLCGNDSLPIDQADVLRARRAAVAAGIGPHEGRWVTVGAALGEPEQKLRLHRDTSAQAVDMESYWIGKAATDAGVPFFAARTVLDSVDMRLPRAVHAGDGEVSALSVLGRALLRPAEVPALAGLGRAMAQARRTLTRFTLALLEQEAQRRTPSVAHG
jgi:nucleoside phosphorylase